MAGYQYDPKLTQALMVSSAALFMLILELFALGPVVDMFVFEAGSFEMTLWGMDLMPDVLIYAEWFYIMIKILTVIFLIYPIIYVIKRHKYSEVTYEEDETWR